MWIHNKFFDISRVKATVFLALTNDRIKKGNKVDYVSAVAQCKNNNMILC